MCNKLVMRSLYPITLCCGNVVCLVLRFRTSAGVEIVNVKTLKVKPFTFEVWIPIFGR